ncbi:MAG: hypothetical protein ACLP3C_33555 [Mycobacterium sp.]|uniref:hypothetical protein n=1 Tax=Mycobacterium sp. TaxID=1785 RepID=UPI003F97896D
MSLQHHETTESTPDAGTQPPSGDNLGRRRPWAWVTWALALLTVPAAALVMVFDVGAAVSTAACSGAQCPALGPHGLVYGVLLYGAPAIAVLTIVASFLPRSVDAASSFRCGVWSSALRRRGHVHVVQQIGRTTGSN